MKKFFKRRTMFNILKKVRDVAGTRNCEVVVSACGRAVAAVLLSKPEKVEFFFFCKVTVLINSSAFKLSEKLSSLANEISLWCVLHSSCGCEILKKKTSEVIPC